MKKNRWWLLTTSCLISSMNSVNWTSWSCWETSSSLQRVSNCSLRASIASIRCSIRARAVRTGFSASSISSGYSRAARRRLRAWTGSASSGKGEGWFMYHVDSVMFRLRIRLRGILSAFREWEIASTNAIKGIGDELIQNEEVEKERKKMKDMMMKKLRGIISLISYSI